MKKISTIAALVLAAGLILAVYVGVLYYGEDIGPNARKFEIRVVPGAYLSDVQRMLVEQGALKHPKLFRWVAVLTGRDKTVQAGRYVFLEGMSIARMLRKLGSAEFEVTRLTIPEGFMLREIAGTVEREVEIDSAQFYDLAHDADFVKRFGINAPSLEGYLFPDTYLLSWPISSKELAKIMVDRFREMFNGEIAKHAGRAGLSTNEIVTLASIIEAEAQNASEMNRISAVYHNRMRKGLRLEADPTVAYALGGVRRGLKYSDLKIDSPYNTYRNKGLPPGPICNPGLSALVAAVRPLGESDDLYFVAAGDGSHLFSRTHDEHLMARKYAKALRDEIAKALRDTIAKAKALPDTAVNEKSKTKEPEKDPGAGE